MTAQSTTSAVTRPSAAVTTGGLILAAIIAVALNTAVAAAAHAAGASHGFHPLQLATYAGLTIAGLPYYTQNVVEGVVLIVALVCSFTLSGGKRS